MAAMGTIVDFYDLPGGYWATDFILGLVHQQVIQGFPDGSFRPDAPMTRAQFAVMLTHAFPGRAIVASRSFEDVPPGYWAAQAIAQAHVQGFLRGYPDDRFRPDQVISRLEILLALATGLGYVPQTSVPTLLAYYNDYAIVPTYAWAKVAAVTERRLVVSYPDPRFLNPSRSATRAEVAAVIYQALVSEDKAPAIPSPYIVSFGSNVVSSVSSIESSTLP